MHKCTCICLHLRHLHKLDIYWRKKWQGAQESNGTICSAGFDFLPFLLFPEECLDDLGAGTGEIPNNAMTASSYLDPGYQPWLGRLYNPYGAWCSATNDGTQYLQVQFSQVREIRQLRTQGSLSEKAWVKTYFIEHSEDGEKWTNYTRLGQVEVMGEYIEKKLSVGLQNSDLACLRKA